MTLRHLTALALLTLWGLAPAPALADTTHTARPGETLESIASQRGLTQEELLESNPGLRGTAGPLEEGQVLALPEGPSAPEVQPPGDAPDLSPPLPTLVRLGEPRSRTGERHRAAPMASRRGMIVRNLLGTARRYTGTPYSMGSTGGGGFDCSGFVMKVFSLHGHKLPRTADVQYGVGVKVPKGQEQPGDLVFFQTYLPGPSHVGIYLGQGRFIHASSSRGVITDHLSSDYYRVRYLGARRVF